MTYSAKKTTEFHINAYRLQYWLYAILNKKFGSEVKFHRDSLHKVYEVNRHGFEIATNTMSISEVKAWFVSKLSECGYKGNDKNWTDALSKTTTRDTGVEKLFIEVREQSTGCDYENRNKQVIVVSVQAYWDKNK